LLAQVYLPGIWIGVLVGMLTVSTSTARAAPAPRPVAPRRTSAKAAGGKDRLEVAFARLERLLRAHAASVGACGPKQFYLAVSLEGDLQMQTVQRPYRSVRCGLLGRHAGDGVIWRRSGVDVQKIRVNVHNLAQVGAPPGKGRVTLHCRPGAGRCVELTLAYGQGVERVDRLSLVLRPAAVGVAQVARAARRFLWLVRNDWRYIRPSTRVERRELRAEGRSRRNWGLLLTIGGVVFLGPGVGLSGLMLQAQRHHDFLGTLMYGVPGVPLLLVGLVATLVGIPVLVSGLKRLARARELEREAGDSGAAVAPRPTRPEHEPRTLAGQLHPTQGSAPFSMSLRFRF
jgi:hypothetical protein